jgi:hypothetical protein
MKKQPTYLTGKPRWLPFLAVEIVLSESCADSNFWAILFDFSARYSGH